MTKYARDEFDKVPETASRQGVHRTASTPQSRGRLWPILAVGVAALAIGLVSFLILPKLGPGGADSQASAVVSEAPLAETGTSPSAAAGPTPGPSTTAGPTEAAGNEPTTEPEPVPSTTTAPGAVLDKTQPVAVYNAAGTSGLAGRVGGTVQADGWTLGQVGNWVGAPQQGSTVFYSGADQLANARALANLLGVPSVVASTEFQAPLVVVLGPGYR